VFTAWATWATATFAASSGAMYWTWLWRQVEGKRGPNVPPLYLFAGGVIFTSLAIATPIYVWLEHNPVDVPFLAYLLMSQVIGTVHACFMFVGRASPN